MAQSPKGRLIIGLYKPIRGNCAIYFYPGVYIYIYTLWLKSLLVISFLGGVFKKNRFAHPYLGKWPNFWLAAYVWNGWLKQPKSHQEFQTSSNGGFCGYVFPLHKPYPYSLKGGGYSSILATCNVWGKSTLLSALSGTLPRRYVVSGHVWSAGSCRRVGVTEGGDPCGDGRWGSWLQGCFNTPLEHTPKPLPRGYKGIPFGLGVLPGVCCNLLEWWEDGILQIRRQEYIY